MGEPSKTRIRGRIDLFFIIPLLWSAIYIGYLLVRHSRLLTNAYDLMIYDYALHNTLAGSFFYVPWFGRTLFYQHFSPILFFLLPLYALRADPRLLLVIQALAAGLSALPFYFLARSTLGQGGLPVLLGCSLLFYRHLHMGTLYDFHPEMMMPFLFFSLFLALEKKCHRWFFICFFLLLMIKEDVSFYLIFVGLYLLFDPDKRKKGMIVMAVSLAWFLVACFVVIPAFNPPGGSIGGHPLLARWEQYGGTAPEILGTISSHPFRFLGDLFRWAHLKTLFNLLAPLLFLPLFSPLVLIPSLPPLILNLTSTLPIQSGLGIYYAAPVFPFLFLALLKTLERIQKKTRTHKIPLFLAAAILIINFFNGPVPRLLQLDNWRVTAHHQSIRDVAAMIPDEGLLEAQNNLVPHIPRRKNIRILGDPCGPARPAHILLDEKSNTWPMDDGVFKRYLQELRQDPSYECVLQKDGYYLYSRSRTSGPPVHDKDIDKDIEFDFHPEK